MAKTMECEALKTSNI